jgi:hypothetical protein
MEAITNSLRAVEIGQPQQFRNLTAFPLLQRNAGKPDYITLSRAVQQETASITEISEGGSVPNLLLDNKGDESVLILDGEELIGAKQNRVANLTILAAAHSKTVIPVSCVEAGRWSYSSRNFDVSERAMFHRGRAAKAAALSSNLKATGTYGADQGQVWNYISEKQARMDVESTTEAMSDMYDQHRGSVEDYVGKFRSVEEQVGVLFAIDGEIEGMDLFDANATLENMLPKLVRSFAIDALESANGEGKPAEEKAASRFLDRVAAAHMDSYPGIGLGTDVRLSAPLVAGGGLVNGDKLIHLAAFRNEAPDQSGDRNEQRSLFETRLRSHRYSRMRRRNKDSDH